MDEPVDLDMAPRTRPRLFALEEADALVSTLEATFERMDPKLARIREIQDLLDDHEAYWEGSGGEPAGAERTEYLRLTSDLAARRADLQGDLDAIHGLGCEVKDVDIGLVDFHARIDGQIAYLCWRRGEPHVAYWHTLESGFAGRRPLSTNRDTEP